MKHGLVMEGGAMRGLFTAGVIDVMMEQNIVFDGAVGVSAGAVFGCNYKSHQIGRVLRYNLAFCQDPRYCSMRSRIKTGDLFGADFCYRQIPDELDFASIDVSFISLKLILPAVANVLKDGGYAASLVKPQFEAGREKVGKKGVVRDPAVHKEVLEHYLEHAREAGFGVLGLTYSPIRGPEGNIEYLGFLQKGAETTAAFDLDALVEESHQTLKEHGEGTV